MRDYLSPNESRFDEFSNCEWLPGSLPTQPVPDTMKFATQFFNEFEYIETPLLWSPPTEGRQPDIEVPSSGHGSGKVV